VLRAARRRAHGPGCAPARPRRALAEQPPPGQHRSRPGELGPAAPELQRPGPCHRPRCPGRRCLRPPRAARRPVGADYFVMAADLVPSAVLGNGELGI
jgi:hypothetical protein